MQLPEHLHFPTRAELIVTADSVHARLYLLGGDRLEELDGVAEPREKLSDNEGSFTSSDGSRVAGPGSDVDDTPRLHEFLKKLSAEMISLTRKHGIQAIRIVMPTRIERPLRELLPSDVETLIETTMDLDLMKSSEEEILERIFA